MENLSFDFALEKEPPGEPVALSVNAAVKLINQQLFEISGPDFIVEGEVSDFNISQGKWVWFSLKDTEENALLKCFMTTFQMNVNIEDGDRIIVHATPKIFAKSGGITLNVNSIEIVGEGALQVAFEKLKKQLETEGLFEESRKRQLPNMPQTIGLITSRDAAACTDFIKIIKNRWGGVNIDLAHVAVQGEKAVESICRAIEYFNQAEEKPDVLVLTRGGGSLEDLSAFNAEAVVRSVFASQVPIVVGIGHERDESLAEFAADKRASTPTHAAELLVPDKTSILREIDMTEERIKDRVEEALKTMRHNTENATLRLTRSIERLKSTVEQVIRTVESMGEVYQYRIEHAQERVKDIIRFIKEFDPTRVLKRGYAIVKDKDKIIKDAKSLQKGDQLTIQLSNGNINSQVL